jgi:alpha-glucosidase
MLLMALRGNVFLYQGEELGLPQAEVPYHRLQDPEAISNWPLTLGRDGARTPMPWRKDAAFAGFSGVEPWLPVDARHQTRAIDAQEKDAASTLNVTRRLIALRKSRASLRLGAMSVIAAKGDLLAFERAWAGERTLCVFNLGESALKFASSETPRASILAATFAGAGTAPPTTLPPLSGYIAAI